jgi:hypothetical protein
MAVHGAFLAACGYYGASSHDFSPQAMHSLYSGAGGGGALALFAAISMMPSRKMYMIGVHLGLLLQALFAIVFAVQIVKSYGHPEKADRVVLFSVMLGGTVLALFAMKALKPKKPKGA